jgi:hypothetical protein
MGHDYQISWEPAGTILSGDESEVRCLGLTDETTQSIRIEDGLPPSLERAILIHETLHQLLNSSGLYLPAEVEEAVVTFLGEALYSHIHANKGFWKYIQSRSQSVSE